MSTPQAAPRIPDPNEQQRRQQENAVDQTANQVGAQQGVLPDTADMSAWEFLGKADVASEELDDELEELLTAELTNKNVFTYLPSFEHADRQTFLIDNEMDRIAMEYAEENSVCTGETRAIMYPEEAEQHQGGVPELTSRNYRRIRAAGAAKKKQTFLSVGGQALDALTSILVESVNRTGDGNESSGRLARLREALM